MAWQRRLEGDVDFWTVRGIIRGQAEGEAEVYSVYNASKHLSWERMEEGRKGTSRHVSSCRSTQGEEERMAMWKKVWQEKFGDTVTQAIDWARPNDGEERWVTKLRAYQDEICGYMGPRKDVHRLETDACVDWWRLRCGIDLTKEELEACARAHYKALDQVMPKTIPMPPL